MRKFRPPTCPDCGHTISNVNLCQFTPKTDDDVTAVEQVVPAVHRREDSCRTNTQRSSRFDRRRHQDQTVS